MFAIVGRYFLSHDELVRCLARDPAMTPARARALWRQVTAHGYNPPGPDRVMEWQARQDFQICPDPNDPDGCNVYRDLEFPAGVYEDIDHCYRRKAGAILPEAS